MQNKIAGCGVAEEADRIAELCFAKRTLEVVIACNHTVVSRDAHGEHLLAAGALAGVRVDRSVRGVPDDRDRGERVCT